MELYREEKRDTQQVKEQDKCPPNQTKEEEIGNLPDKEFRIMIVKMIQNLLIRFSFFLSDSFLSTILSSTSLILSSASIILLFVASRVFLISFIALFIIY